MSGTTAKKVKRLTATASDIATALEKRFPANAYAIIYEVGDGTGMNCSRHCDALVQSLWPSRGLSLSGFEFKVSRTDWVKERDNPAKSESILRFCDHWWLAVSDESFVHPGELPETWGMMALKGGVLRVVKDAPKLSPLPLDRSMLAAICRRVSEPVANLAKIEVEKVRREAYEHGVSVGERTARDRREHVEKVDKAIADFKAASGIDIRDTVHEWRYPHFDAKKLGEAVKLVLSGGLSDQVQSLRSYRRQLDAMLSATDAAIVTGEELKVVGGDANEGQI